MRCQQNREHQSGSQDGDHLHSPPANTRMILDHGRRDHRSEPTARKQEDVQRRTRRIPIPYRHQLTHQERKRHSHRRRYTQQHIATDENFNAVRRGTHNRPKHPESCETYDEVPPPEDIRYPPNNDQRNRERDGVDQRDPDVVIIRPDVCVYEAEYWCSVAEGGHSGQQTQSHGETRADEEAAPPVAIGEGGGVDGLVDDVEVVACGGVGGGIFDGIDGFNWLL